MMIGRAWEYWELTVLPPSNVSFGVCVMCGIGAPGDECMPSMYSSEAWIHRYPFGTYQQGLKIR